MLQGFGVLAFPIIETFRNDTKYIYLQLKKNGENEAKDMKLNGEQVGFPYLTHWCDCKLAKCSMKLVSKFTLQ